METKRRHHDPIFSSRTALTERVRGGSFGVGWLAAFALVFAACAAGGNAADAGAADLADEPDLVTAPDLSVPSTPAGAQLAWLLALLEGGPASIDAPTVQPHFAPAFLSQLPIDQLVAVLMQLAAAGPYVLTAIENGAGDYALVADVRDGSDRYARVRLATEHAPAGRITSLWIQPAPDLDAALPDFAALDARVPMLASTAALYVAEVAGGRCTARHALLSSKTLALGSQFKLYVLSALASWIAGGHATWDTPLAIHDDWKSLPSGTWQDQPAGTTFTLAEFAAQMISISDNTAADHLVRYLGRATVEAQLGPAGHHDPTLDEPFLDTRELFQLKLAATAQQRADYLAATSEGRRTLLDTVYDPMSLDVAAARARGWTSPILVDKLEWFATPEDICRVFAALAGQAAAAGGQPVFDALSQNPGVAIDAATFPWVGYKGGSEPGVLTLGWLLRRSDGRWFVVDVGWNDTKYPIDEDAAVYLAERAVQLVAGL